MPEEVRVEIANQPKCPACGCYRLQQQLNPRWFQCLACGGTFLLRTWKFKGNVWRKRQSGT